MNLIKKRRRGNTLKISIYEAVISLLKYLDYDHLNFTNIAIASSTSRSVLYRYWDTKFDLIFEALWYKNNLELNIVDWDQGSLKNDLLFLGKIWLEKSNGNKNPMFKPLFMSNSLNKENFVEVKEQAFSINVKVMSKIIRLAIQRGEIQYFPPVSTQLIFFEIIRYREITGEKINKKAVLDIIENIVLPAIIYKSN